MPQLSHQLSKNPRTLGYKQKTLRNPLNEITLNQQIKPPNLKVFKDFKKKLNFEDQSGVRNSNPERKGKFHQFAKRRSR